MTHRRTVLIFLSLILFVLILSPWTLEPSPSLPDVPPQTGKKSDPAEPAPASVLSPVTLRVAAALDPAEFEFLRQQNAGQQERFPDHLSVELVRVEPGEAYAAFRTASRVGESADVMLLPNEWVLSFAASGFLLPSDGAFVGEALSEQFEAISASLKWNGYIWGVPRDIDPYVVVWNLAVLKELSGENAVPAKNLAQWSELAARSEAGAAKEEGSPAEQPAQAIPWLVLNPGDPLALLSWIQTASGKPTDTIWDKGNPWSGTPAGEALGLLERQRNGVAFGASSLEVAAMLRAGKAASAVLPYSDALDAARSRDAEANVLIATDDSAWRKMQAWPRGRSFVVSSRTEAADAAHRWIAFMTEAAGQRENFRTFGKLPVYRSLFQDNGKMAAMLPEITGSVNPFQTTTHDGPYLPVRLGRLSAIWAEWSEGRLSLEDWVRRWPELSADLQLDD